MNLPGSNRISVSRSELLAFAKNEMAFWGIDLDRLSSILLAQLLQLGSHRTIDIFNVTKEIKTLEGIDPKTKTKKECSFNRGTPLGGLWYKHFTDARFVMANLDSEYGYQNEENEGLGNEKLGNLVGRLYHERKGECAKEGFARVLAHEITVEAYKSRAKRGNLTGEWIVYWKHRGDRFYLCLASHSETNEKILSRAQSAIAMDFNFLCDIQD